VKRYELTAAAEANLTEILLYLAEEASEATALRHLARLTAAFELLAKHPGVGHRRADARRPVLFWPVGNYMVAYLPRSQPTRIVSVLHGARDIAGLLDDTD
jgi:plasmid stabilization system protein ParE